MKKRNVGKLIGCFMVAGVLLSGCGSNTAQQGASSDTLVTENVTADQPAATQAAANQQADAGETAAENDSEENADTEDMILEIQLGYGGNVYKMELYDNVTAQELYRDLGDRHYNLPIYHYDDFEQADVIQYYDLPMRYSYTVEDAVEVGEVKAGELYYSDPNRIILVYRDTTLEGEYVPIGMVDIDDPEAFARGVENSSVLDDWDCKVVPVHRLGVAFSR